MLYIHHANGDTFGFIITDQAFIKCHTGNLEMVAPSCIKYTNMISGYSEHYLSGLRFTTAYLYQVKEVYKDEVIINGRVINLRGDMEVLIRPIVG
jgi:hypothetical protein|nr:MAG TPA: hypothetical protein [Caudoviricetes sp.]